jgi:carbon monoxide dehydrogenase subunit G
MASIRKEILVDAPPAFCWEVLRDVGALHTRLVPGFVTDTVLEAGARVVTFGNGMVARELIVDVDDEARRIVWSVVGGSLAHHNASVQVFDDGRGGSRLVWIADLLPHAAAPHIRAMIDHAASVMQPTLEAGARSSHAAPATGS